MILKNRVLKRQSNKPIVYDVFYKASIQKKPLVIFCHGYKGFKDWGAWDLVAEKFMRMNCVFLKFNFSHNGGTIENPIDFSDLEAFAQNNYTKELSDLKDILDYILDQSNPFAQEIDSNHITLIGHSRGGGIASIFASEDSRVTKLITWASVADFQSRFGTHEDILKWKHDGVRYVKNGRTKQQMPHHYQFYKNFKKNETRLHIETAIRAIQIPQLIIHSKDDVAVGFSNAINLNKWNPKSKLIGLENTNHVFDTSHPWNKNTLPEKMNEVIKHTIDFIS